MTIFINAAPTSPDTSTSFASPHFILRVGGLPIERAMELRTTRSAQWTADVLALDRDLRRRAPDVTELVYQAISQSKNRTAEHVLLSLKRDVFNVRVPKDILKIRNRVAQLPPEFSWPIADWLDLAERYAQLLTTGGDVLAAEVAQKRRLLKSTLADETFRKGLVIASSEMEQSIDAYIAAADTSTNRRLRSTERSALLYLFRTACKTSPFSTLTPVAWGAFDDAPHRSNGRVHYEFPERDLQTECALNVAILSRLSGYLVQAEDVWPELPVSLNESLAVEPDRVRYLRRIFRVNDQGGRQAFDEVKEVSFFLPTSAAIRQVIGVVSGAGTITAREVVDQLTGPPPSGLPRHEAIALVRLLMELDLVVNTTLRVALTSADPFAEFIAGLDGLPIPRVQEMSTRLKDVRSSLAGFPVSSSRERRAKLDAIRREIGTAFTLVDQTAAELPSTIIYEDAVCHFTNLSLPADVWAPHLNTLSDIQRVLPVFDSSITLKLAMKSFFKAVFGAGQRCDDVVSFVELFKHDYYDGYRRSFRGFRGGKMPNANPLGLPEIDLMERLRKTVTDHAEERYASRENPSEVVLDGRVLQEVAALVPPRLHVPASHAFAVQLAETEAGARLVVNRIYSGMGQLFSRFLWLLDGDRGRQGLVRSCRELLVRMQPPGAVMAELLGGNDTNLNLHPELAPYEIVFPSSRTLRRADAQIPVADLYLAHDEADDSLQLRSRRLGRQVIPLYLGLMVPMALPDIHQILLNISSSSIVAVPSLLRGVQQGGDGETIRFTPRVRCGDVVLDRATWHVPASSMPLRASCNSDADYYLAVTRWRQTHGISAQVFLTHSPERPQPRAGEAPRDAPRSEPEDSVGQLIRKPILLDFANYLSVMLLDHVLAAHGNRTLLLTEVLPAEDELWLRNAAGSYVSEFLIEMNLVRGINA